VEPSCIASPRGERSTELANLYYLWNKEKMIKRERGEERRGGRKKGEVNIERGQGLTKGGHEVSLVTTATEKMRAQP